MKAEVQTKERQLEEVLNSLYLEHRLDKEVVIDGRQHTEHDDDRQDGVEINSHWMRLVGGKHLVLGLELLCSCDNARDLCLQLQQRRLVGVSSPGSVSTLHTMSSHQTDTMVAILSSPCSLSTKTLPMLASVSDVANDHNIVTDTVQLSLTDEPLRIKFESFLSENDSLRI